MPITESQLQEQVARYLCENYPDVLFHSDFGSGVKLTPAQAKRQSRQNGGRRAWPDMFIAEPMEYQSVVVGERQFDTAIKKRSVLGKKFPTRHQIYTENSFCWIVAGLFLELKREGTRLKKKDGTWANEHVEEQAKILDELDRRGYRAEFAVGFNEAKKIIDEYLGGNSVVS